MFKRRFLTIGPLAALALASVSVATAVRADDWTGKGEAGFLLSRGNADATSANAKLDVALKDGPWKNSLFFGGLYGKNAAFTTAQRIEGRYELDHTLTDRLYWFGALHAEDDKFSGFAYQASLSTGVGYKFIDTDATKLSATVGVGYRRLVPETLTKSPAGEILTVVKGEATGNAVADAALNFAQQLTNTTKLTDKVQIESGSSNTSAANDLALAVSISSRLALSLGYSVHFNSNPPAGSTRIDQLTTVNLVYDINPPAKK